MANRNAHLLITKHQLDSVLLQYLIPLVAFLRVYFKGITGWLLCKTSFRLHLHANELGKNLLGKKGACRISSYWLQVVHDGILHPTFGGQVRQLTYCDPWVISETILPK